MVELGRYVYLVVACLCLVSVTVQGIPTTMGPPTTTAECSSRHDSKVDNCFAFFCYQGRWQRFEFTATEDCCQRQQDHDGDVHPRCRLIFPERFGTTSFGIFG